MGLITRAFTYIAGRTIKASEVNTNEELLYSLVNGNIESSNIKNNTITSEDLADSANPATYLYDTTGQVSFISTGLAVIDGSSGDSAKATVLTGIYYTVVSGQLVRHELLLSATHTFSGDGTFYLFIDSTGTLSESASITPAAGTQLLAKCIVTETAVGLPDAVVAVTDMARRSPIYLSEHELHGFNMVYASTTTINVTGGYCDIGGIKYKNNFNTDAIDVTSGANYISASAPSSDTWVYVYLQPNVTTLAVALDETPPDFADTNGSQSGTLYYYKNGSNYYRCIGAFYWDNGNTKILEFTQDGDYFQLASGRLLSDGTGQDAFNPAVSVRGYFHCHAHGVGQKATLRAVGFGDYIGAVQSGVEQTVDVFTQCPTVNQQIDVSMTNTPDSYIKTIGWWTNVRNP